MNSDFPVRLLFYLFFLLETVRSLAKTFLQKFDDILRDREPDGRNVRDSRTIQRVIRQEIIASVRLVAVQFNVAKRVHDIFDATDTCPDNLRERQCSQRDIDLGTDDSNERTIRDILSSSTKVTSLVRRGGEGQHVDGGIEEQKKKNTTKLDYTSSGNLRVNFHWIHEH